MNNKVVLITGASSGIGEACAYVFAAAGYQVMLMARNENKLQELAAALHAKGAKAGYVAGDVRVEKDCQQAVNNTIEQFGQLDVLVNNAGISMRALFASLDLRVMEEVMQTNFWGAVYCTKYALPELLRNKGSVIGVNSWAGFTGLPARTGYSASKYAMLGFMEALRVENRRTGLHVGSIFPGYTRSNIRNTALNAAGQAQAESPFDEKKLLSPEVVAQQILWMVTNRVNNHVVSFSGKFFWWLRKLLPRIADRIVYNVVSKEKDSPFK